MTPKQQNDQPYDEYIAYSNVQLEMFSIWLNRWEKLSAILSL